MNHSSPSLARPRISAERDLFFDAVRAVAIVRVVAWHTLQWPVLSYIAAMPVMFFLGGTLARASFEGRRAPTVVRRRLFRLLPSLWAYGAVAWLVFVLGGAAVNLRALIWWVVPLWDPTGPDAAVAWWAPLWYLRAYLWLVLLTPLLLLALRRLGTVASLSIVTALAAGVALAADSGVDLPSQLQELTLYGAFWSLGLASTRIRARFGSITAAQRSALAAVVAAGAVAWMILQPPPLGIVNASPMAELLFGVAWIIGLTAIAAPIVRVASFPRVRPVVDVLNRRAMSIYLWHCGAIAIAHAALESVGIDGPLRTAALALLVALVTTGLVTAAGPVEDLTATRRRMPSTRSRVLVGAFAVPCLLVAATVFPVADLENAEGAYVPASGRGLDRLIEDDAAEAPIEDDWVQPLGPVTDAELDALVAEWRETWDMSGVLVAISRSDGNVWTGADGNAAGTGDDMHTDQIIAAHSITKSFTGALVTQLHAEGLLDLDERLAVWLPEFPHASQVTLRQLAQHTSGLIDTGEEPDEAIRLAGEADLLFTPGEGTRYSDSAYYLLGMVAERATGQPYEQLLQDRFFGPLALADTTVGPERWSAGGVLTTVGDLARWAPTFWGGGLGAEVAAQATQLDPQNNFGVGTFGYCPCRGLGDTYRADVYGHLSAHGRLAWDPGDDLAVMIHTNEENDGDHAITAWTTLDRLLRRQVEGRSLATTAVPITAADITPLTSEPAGA
jgi:CubicO group peptidase (beta-lactamase class C family)/peptidoglycan/LPS O-acetylase OafA/YrhL